MQQVVLFSGIEGQVVRNGQPVSGAKLSRFWDFSQDQVRGQDETITDTLGRFRMPTVMHTTRKPRFLAQQFVVSQVIRLKTGDRDWEVWVASKHEQGFGTERGSTPLSTPDLNQHLRVLINLDAPMALRGGVAGHTLFVD